MPPLLDVDVVDIEKASAKSDGDVVPVLHDVELKYIIATNSINGARTRCTTCDTVISLYLRTESKKEPKAQSRICKQGPG